MPAGWRPAMTAGLISLRRGMAREHCPPGPPPPALALGAVEAGGEDVYGRASGVQIWAGSQVVENGGSAIVTTVNWGGTQVVLNGGSAINTDLEGGTEIVAAGGSDRFATINNGEQDVYG